MAAWQDMTAAEMQEAILGEHRDNKHKLVVVSERDSKPGSTDLNFRRMAPSWLLRGRGCALLLSAIARRFEKQRP